MDKATAALKPILLDLLCWQMKYFPDLHVSASICPACMHGDLKTDTVHVFASDGKVDAPFSFFALDARKMAGGEVDHAGIF